MQRLLIVSAFLIAVVSGFVVSNALADPPAGNGTSSSSCTAGNGEGWKSKQCATPAPTATPSPTPPSAHVLTQADYGTAYGVNGNTNTTNTDNWLNYCFTTIDVDVFNCDGNPAKPLIYMSATLFQAHGTGTTTNYPWHSASNANGRTCPAPTTGNLMTATGGQWPTSMHLQETWFQHVYGTSSTTANRIAAFYHEYTGSNDAVQLLPMDIGNTSLQQYVAAWLQNCEISVTIGGVSTPFIFDSVGVAIFEDNGGNMMAENLWALGDGYGYTIQKNTGSATSVPSPAEYSSQSCATLWSTTTVYCESATQISTAAANKTFEYGTSVDTNYHNAWTGLIQNGFVHFNGTEYPLEINEGHSSTDFSQIAASTNVIGLMMEKQVITGGGNTYNYYVESVIDTCTSLNATYTYAGCVLEDTDPANSTAKNGGVITPDPIGSDRHQQNLRTHFGVLWLLYSDATVDHADLDDDEQAKSTCGAGGTSQCNGVGVWPMDFVHPSNPVQTAAVAQGNSAGACSYYMTNLCTSHGYRDLVVAGSGNAVVLVREFNDCWYQPSFINSHTGQTDLGMCGVVVNLETSSVPFQTTWLTNWSSYLHMIVLCTPGTGATYTSPNCTPATSGGDVGSAALAVGSGPGAINYNTIPASWASGQSIGKNDAWFFIAQ